MLRNRNIISLDDSLTVLLILFNVIIIEKAYTHDQNLYWILLITLPVLGFIMYRSRKLINIFPHGHTDKIQQNHFYKSPIEKSLQTVSDEEFDTSDLTVLIGNDQCTNPCNISILNIGLIKSFRKNYLEDGNTNMFDLTEQVEEKTNTKYLSQGGLVWEIGPEYSGCRSINGDFNSYKFKENAARPEVKIIQVELSLSDFHNADGMIHFIGSLREYSAGKPIGFKTRISSRKEFYHICHAIRKINLVPDFIVVEGSDVHSYRVNLKSADNVEMPLYEAIQFVSKTLQVYGLETKIKIVASGEINSGFDMFKIMLLGAQAVQTSVPVSRIIKLHDSKPKTALFYQRQDISDFHNNIIEATSHIMKYYGINTTSELSLAKYFRNLVLPQSKNYEIKNYSIKNSGLLKELPSYMSGLNQIKNAKQRMDLWN
jgi:hypothetical protein